MWWGKSKQEEVKRGAGMLAFPVIFSSTEFREAAERGPETGKIPFLWSNAFWNVVMFVGRIQCVWSRQDA